MARRLADCCSPTVHEISRHFQYDHAGVDGGLGDLLRAGLGDCRIPDGGVGVPPWPGTFRHLVPWSGVDVLLFVAVFLAISLTLPPLINPGRATEEAELQPRFLVSFALAELLGCALGAAVVAYSSSATWRDLGWRRRGWGRDVMVGLALFAALSPPVFSLQFVLSSLFEPTRHPLVKFLLETRTTSAFVASVLTAVVAAPVVEEFFFRVLLQGWLERLAVVRPWSPPPVAEPQGTASMRSADAEVLRENTGPSTSPTASLASAAGPVAFAAGGASWWPIGVSAAFFALAHWNHGPDPIPLFGLGLGLGYTYRQTHRLLPCVVLHACVNTFSLFVIWLS